MIIIKTDTMFVPVLQLIIHDNDANMFRCLRLWPGGDVSYATKRRGLVSDQDWI